MNCICIILLACSVNQICSRPRTPSVGLPRFPANAAHAGGDASKGAAMNHGNGFRDLTGERYGRLEVIQYSHKNHRNQTYWLCVCKCGEYTVARGSHLQQKNVSSCGCYGREQGVKAVTKHGGCSGGVICRTYITWRCMISRCLLPGDTSFRSYGGRGIQVCRRWLESYDNFVADMGIRPQGKTLDRKNTNGHYHKENCRWATPQEQADNKRHPSEYKNNTVKVAPLES